MVRCYPTIGWPMYFGSKTGFKNQFDTPPTTSSFTKVPSKPTNHSKYTSKDPFDKLDDLGCDEYFHRLRSSE